MNLVQGKLSALNSQMGFSLVEIMVAFAILGVGMLGVGTMLVTSMQQDEYTSKMQFSDKYAMDLLEELRADSVEGSITNTQGVYKNIYNYRVWVTNNEPTSGIDRVDVWIGWDGSGCNQTNPLDCKYKTKVTNYLVQ